MRARLAGGLLVLLQASAAGAEERFYPVVGPDGRIEMIRSEDKSAAAAPARGDAPAADKPAANAPAQAEGGQGGQGGQGAEPPAVRPLPHAAYDSDEYVDSEAMDSATTPAANGKRRFYTINDGMGIRTSESPAAEEEQAAPAPPPRKASVPERWEAVVSGRRHWSGEEAVQAMPWLPRCLAASWLREQPLLGFADSVGVVVDRQDYAFLDGNRVLAGWQLEAGGLRTLALRSYSRKVRDAAYLDPRLAFLDAKGCVTRVEQGLFERRYAATDQRHGYLWGELVVHVDEGWVLLLAPPGDEPTAGKPSWRASRLGQLKLTLKK